MSDELPDDVALGLSEDDYEFIQKYIRKEVTEEEFRARYEKDGKIAIPVTVMPTCCFCGAYLPAQKGISPGYWGNNPAPVMKDGDNRCCDSCNANIVVPARIERRRNGRGR